MASQTATSLCSWHHCVEQESVAVLPFAAKCIARLDGEQVLTLGFLGIRHDTQQWLLPFAGRLAGYFRGAAQGAVSSLAGVVIERRLPNERQSCVALRDGVASG